MTHAKADAPHPCVSCGRPTIVLTRSASGEEHAECMDCWVRATRDASLQQPATPAPQVTSGGLVLVADVDREQVTWLWPGRIPRGKVSVLDGDPGTGKSILTLTIAAKVTTGSPFPDGARPERGDVILLNAEDDIGDTIRPRLEAAGADLSRCWVLPDVHPEGAPPRPPELPADLFLLEDLVKSKAAALVVLDPLMALLSGSVDSHRDQDIRRVLASLAYMAARTSAAVVIVRHMNKGTGSALYRGSGSIGIVGAARAGLLVAPDPDDDGRRILAMTKSNLAKMPDALAYRLVDDERYGVARVVWDGASARTANDLVRARVDEDEAPALAEAMRVLKEILADGPLAAGNVKRLAATAGVAERTLQRVRHALGVTARRQGFGPGAFYIWSMPADPAQAMAQGTHGIHAMDATCQDPDEDGDHGRLPYPDDDPDDPRRFTR
jgi:AAA domain